LVKIKKKVRTNDITKKDVVTVLEKQFVKDEKK
jgi:hypothetical protein